MAQEQERGITITSAATTTFWSYDNNKYKINLIAVSYTHLDVYKRQVVRSSTDREPPPSHHQEIEDDERPVEAHQ